MSTHEHPFELALDTVEIPVSDLRASIRWYAEKLGIRSEWNDSSFAVLPIRGTPGVKLFLVQTTDPRRLAFANSATGVVHTVVDFRVGDLDAAHDVMVARGAKVGELKPASQHTGPGPRGFAVTDPDGNRIGLCEYAGNP